jgi:hypothetical protein
MYRNCPGEESSKVRMRGVVPAGRAILPSR